MKKGKEVKCVMVYLYCDKCGTELEITGGVQLTCPPRYIYACPQCGYKESHSESYPRVEYVEVQESEKKKEERRL